jgi:hypothetical protein
MMVTMSQQGFPFVVGPVSSDRIQFWASYAGYVSTREGFNAVSYAFTAFWFEACTEREYQSALHCLQRGWEPQVIGWLDGVVSSQQHVAGYWAQVVRLMDEHQELRLQSRQWLEDAMQHVQAAIDLRLQVATQIAIWCDQYQQVLPEHTQAFFTEVQAKGM